MPWSSVKNIKEKLEISLIFFIGDHGKWPAYYYMFIIDLSKCFKLKILLDQAYGLIYNIPFIKSFKLFKNHILRYFIMYKIIIFNLNILLNLEEYHV